MAEPEVQQPDGTEPGAGLPAYTAQFKDELKNHEVWKEFASMNDIGKYVVDAKAKEKASVADIAQKPEDYAFDKIDFPKGLDVEEAFEKAYREQAKNLNLTKKQAAELYKWYNGSRIASFNASMTEYEKAQKDAEAESDKAMKDAEEALKKEWGKEYDGNLELFARAVDTFGTAELTAVLKSTNLASNPIIIKTFAAIGKAMSEDKLVTGKPASGTGANAPDSKTGALGITTLSYPSMDKK